MSCALFVGEGKASDCETTQIAGIAAMRPARLRAVPSPNRGLLAGFRGCPRHRVPPSCLRDVAGLSSGLFAELVSPWCPSAVLPVLKAAFHIKCLPQNIHHRPQDGVNVYVGCNVLNPNVRQQ